MKIKFKTYQLIERAVEEGLVRGYRRAHKHNDSPGEDELNQAILEAVMFEISEIIDFEE